MDVVIRKLERQTKSIVGTSIVTSIILTALFIWVLLSPGTSNAIVKAARDLTATSDAETYKAGLVAIGAGIASISFVGAGIGIGFAAGKAAEAVGRNPEAEAKIRNMMFIGAAVAESSALYGLVIAILCIFVA